MNNNRIKVKDRENKVGSKSAQMDQKVPTFEKVPKKKVLREFC